MKLSKIISRTESKKSIRGQGMSEYMIILGVIAAAAIGTFGYFGGTVEEQMGTMTKALTGTTNVAATTAQSTKAITTSTKANSLKTFNEQ